MLDFNSESNVLKKSPLFNLSLSSKELFHSNYLAWLCETYPNCMGNIINEYLLYKSSSDDINSVKREERHLDITITYKDGTRVIIELKIKSIPNEEQLIEYSEDNNDDKCNYLLLSIVKPHFFEKDDTFTTKNGRKWKRVKYSDFIENLKNITTYEKEYHRFLVEDYVSFTKELCGLIERFDINEYTNNKGGFLLEENEIIILRNLRILDVIYKLRYSQLAGEVFNELKTKYKDRVVRKDWWIKENGEQSVRESDTICVNDGYTNGTGITEVGLVINKKYHFICGIQFQAEQFRLFIIGGDKIIKENDFQSIINNLYSNEKWFVFGNSKTNYLEQNEYPKRGKIFNQFTKYFRYRYRPIKPETPTKHIVDEIAFFINEIDSKKEEINSILENHLNNYL